MLMKVMTRRLESFAENRILMEAQGGFKSHRKCLDQWLVLRRKREKKTLYFAFLDVSKAYDSV